MHSSSNHTSPPRIRDAESGPCPSGPRTGSVVAVLVGLSGVKCRILRFFVEQDVAHGVEDVRIESEAELPDVTGARVGIQNLVQLPPRWTRSPSRFDRREFKPDVLELGASVESGGVKLNGSPERSLEPDRKTSPSGMFRVPSHGFAPMPLMLNRRSVPGPLRWTRSARSFGGSGEPSPSPFGDNPWCRRRNKSPQRPRYSCWRPGPLDGGPAEDAPFCPVHPVVEHWPQGLGVQLKAVAGDIADSEALWDPRMAM